MARTPSSGHLPSQPSAWHQHQSQAWEILINPPPWVHIWGRTPSIPTLKGASDVSESGSCFLVGCSGNGE